MKDTPVKKYVRFEEQFWLTQLNGIFRHHMFRQYHTQSDANPEAGAHIAAPPVAAQRYSRVSCESFVCEHWQSARFSP